MISDPTREYGIGRIEFYDGPALVYWEAWISLGIQHPGWMDRMNASRSFA